MEILKILLDFFINNQQNEVLKNLFSVLKDGSFDLNALTKNFSVDKIMPFLESFFSQNKKPEGCENSYASGDCLDEIKGVADPEIYSALSSYFSA